LKEGGVMKKGIGLLRHNTLARLAKIALDYIIQPRVYPPCIDAWTWELADFEFYNKTKTKPNLLNGLTLEQAFECDNPRVHQKAALAMTQLWYTHIHTRAWITRSQYFSIIVENR